jgi:hypothetical protein
VHHSSMHDVSGEDTNQAGSFSEPRTFTVVIFVCLGINFCLVTVPHEIALEARCVLAPVLSE